jgi:hypothetical protein
MLALLLLASGPASAQIQIDAGGGNLWGGSAAGFGITTYANGGQQYAGVSILGGKIVPGASYQFSAHGLNLVAGTQSLGYSFDSVGIGISLVGASAKKISKDKRTNFALFVGAVGAGEFLPFSTGVLPQHFGAGILFEHDFQLSEKSRLKVSTLNLIAGGQRTAAQGFSFTHSDTLKFSGSAGLLNNSRFANASANWRPVKRLSIFADHADYFSPIRASGNSAGASLSLGFINVQGGLNNSTSAGTHTTGENAGVGFHVGPITENSTLYRSGTRTLVSHLVTARITPRLTITGNLNQSGGRNSFALGGAFVGRRATLSVQHSVQFLLNGAGYQTTTGVSVSFRIRDTTINAATVTDPFGKTRWTSGGESFVQANLPFLKSDASTNHASGGKFQIVGICKLETGEPVDGCAVRVGSVTAFSNSRGEFAVRVKRNKSASVQAALDEFTAPGKFEVVACPADAEPGRAFAVVVKRGAN